ncbi:hypothetical protein [Methanomethylophilus alvi]|uniref:hypothetical protein n=1 Tax=Methanomethylophilus alvi TaxID=1291540 RepID=UPI0037DD38C5
MNSEKRKLEYGEVTKIACGDMNIRVYDTKDAIDDRVIILDKDGRGVVVELPAFRRNIEELAHYLEDENVTIEGKLVSYHAAGSSFLPSGCEELSDRKRREVQLDRRRSRTHRKLR